MMAAIKAKEEKNDVILIEKMNSLGKKLLITGKGRCNITSSISIDEFINNIPGNGKFLHSALKKFTNIDIIKFLNDGGIQTKVERGNRIFPVTDKSADVLNVFINKLNNLNVKIIKNLKVDKIIAHNNKVIGIKTDDDRIIKADKVILATGGNSYKLTGSTGDGYKMAKELGHTIIDIKPSLVPLNIYESDICKQMQGLSLKNVKIVVVDNKKVIYEDFGEMLFTHFGVSGPVILSASAIIFRYKNINKLLQERKIKIIIDWKPSLSEEKLDLRLLRDFNEYKNKQYINSLDKLLPSKSISTIVDLSKIDKHKRVNEINKNERKNLVHLLKNFELTVKSFRDINEAIVTAGGISTKEINPKTMESKIIEGLYFAGEIIDVDGYTGGFNLQIAYSTGYVAGTNKENL